MKFLLFIALICVVFPLSINAQNCSGWGDGIDSIKTKRYYDEYRKMVASYHYQDAVFFWNYVFKKAPSATKNIYLDGVKMYRHFYSNEKNSAKQQAHLDKLMAIYDQRLTCYPDDAPNILARKAIELYNLKVDLELTANVFAEAMSRSGDAMPSFALVPYAKVVGQLYMDQRISLDERDGIQQKITALAQRNIDSDFNKDDYYAALVHVKKEFRDAVVPIRMADINEPAANNGDCARQTNLLKRRIQQAPDDDRLLMKTINELNNMDCADAQRYANTLLAMQEQQIRSEMNGGLAMKGNTIASANFAFKNGDYEKAIELYGDAIAETNDINQKATYHLQIAKIHYAKLDNKATAKQHLLTTLEYQPKNGEAYIILGDLYVAGAQECFPTDAFAQKMVIYAAIDQWKKAAKVDDAVTDKADERIKKYKNYLPSKSELFLARSHFKGKTYKIGCWIDEKVKVNN